MPKRVTIINGHPDADPQRFCSAIAETCKKSALEAGHEVRSVLLAEIEIPLLKSREEWTEGAAPDSVRAAQESIAWAQHLVFIYPLWLGDMPALLKAFLEQALRPDFAFKYGDKAMPEKLLKGRSARVIVTMGMPALFYRAYYGAYSIRSFKRNILAFTGIGPVETSLIGNVEGSKAHRERWLRRIAQYGRAAD